MLTLFEFPEPLRKACFIKRYKRFFADVLLEDLKTIEAVHCANSGSMRSCLQENAVCYTLDSKNEARKLRHSLELIELGDGFVEVNTQRANQCVERLLESIIKQDNAFATDIKNKYFRDYQTFNREVKYNDETRFDFCLYGKNKNCWVEVKSVSLKLDENTLSFPDAVTQRGQKHLIHLMEAVNRGDDAWLIFPIMRSSKMSSDIIIEHFRIASEIDKKYAQLFLQALENGVNVGLVLTEIDPLKIQLKKFHFLEYKKYAKKHAHS